MRIARMAAAGALGVLLATAIASHAAEPNWPDHLTIGTASPGGTYHVYGEGLARILTRNLDLPVVRRPTDGPAQNIEILEAGEAKNRIRHDRHRAAGMERDRHVGRKEPGPFDAGDLSNVRHAVPAAGDAGIKHPLDRRHGGKAHRRRTARRDFGDLLSRVLRDAESPGDISCSANGPSSPRR